MNSYEPRRPVDDAYTGETIVMRDRRAAPPGRAPLRPIAPRRLPWRWLRRGLLIAAGLVLLLLIVFYLQLRSVASRIVVGDVRPNAPIASPLTGGMNLLIVGVDERAGHPEEGVRSDTLILVHLDALGRWAGMLSIPRDTRVELLDIGST